MKHVHFNRAVAVLFRKDVACSNEEKTIRKEVIYFFEKGRSVKKCCDKRKNV